MSRVVVSVNGHRVKALRARGKSLIRIRISRSARVQRVVARVSFTSNARPRSKTLRTTVLRCQSVSGVLPSFTG